MSSSTQSTQIDPRPVELHNSSVTHAGKIVGRYPSGNAKLATRCGVERRSRVADAHATSGPVTCKRCLSRLAALEAVAR